MPTTKLVSGKLQVDLNHEYTSQLADMDGKLVNPNHVVQGPLIPTDVTAEDESLPSDDDICSSESENVQEGVASDKNIMSGSDSDDN